MTSPTDIVVIGAGHAGTEAAHAAARRGARVALVLLDRGTLGAMSCNPSIGGVGKGHIVREVDALDGVMAFAADAAAIHYRMLNASKGAAVRGPRVQADRARYAHAISQALALAGVQIVEGEAVRLEIVDDHIRGVELADGRQLDARAVVVATGTFLGATMFRGRDRDPGSRIGERAAGALADQLRDLGLTIGRMKTGTPPRLDGRTIDWARLVEQPSDEREWTMSPITSAARLPQLSCALARTTTDTHAVIADNMYLSPMRSGAIGSGGPRYCPSIEDKVDRFGNRDGHQVFLEPEGLDTAIVYPNGLSTSLPTDVQQLMVNSIGGLERAAITTPGYAVEYGHIDPRALDHRLGYSPINGLFFAGQINGTTGYEEAAGQGVVAGMNAAAVARELAPVLLDRASSYIGVMIDDLVLQGVTEPYRMLTARAEYRLSLRADNAETRLEATGRAAGCLSAARLRHLDRRNAKRADVAERLNRRLSAADLADAGAPIARDGPRRSAAEWLRQGKVDAALLVPDLDDHVTQEVIEDTRYAPYLDRQAAEIIALRRTEQTMLPVDFQFADVPGLSIEMIERLSKARPRSIAAVGRVRGVTPAAVSAVLLQLARRERDAA